MRFHAAFLLFALILLFAPAGHLLATFLSGIEPELLGSFRPYAYLGSWLIFAVPNAFVTTALLFAMAVLSRRAIISFLCGVFLLFLTLYCWGFLSDQMGRWELAKLLDPVGFTVGPNGLERGLLLKRVFVCLSLKDRYC